MKTLSATELHAQLADFTLIDVRLGDDYEAEHLPEAINHCVFEVTFLEKVSKSVPGKSAPICVYGAESNSHEAEVAAEKLRRAGYTDVSEFRGGLAGWKDSGLATIPGKSVQKPLAPEGRYDLDLEESRLEWIGRNLINKHEGTIDIANGYLEFSEGHLIGGAFEFDMSTINPTDLDGDLREGLIAHLKSDDFFDVERFPKAMLVIRSATEIEGARAGGQNLRIEGDLTIKARSNPIEFEAVAGLTEGGQPAAQAAFVIDRTRWDILYGSGKFFKRLAGHLVNDPIELQVRVLTK